MTDAERIALVRDFANETIGGVHAMNSPGGQNYKGVAERRATVKLLTALLGRKPSDQEIEDARGG